MIDTESTDILNFLKKENKISSIPSTIYCFCCQKNESLLHLHSLLKNTEHQLQKLEKNEQNKMIKKVQQEFMKYDLKFTHCPNTDCMVFLHVLCLMQLRMKKMKQMLSNYEIKTCSKDECLIPKMVACPCCHSLYSWQLYLENGMRFKNIFVDDGENSREQSNEIESSDGYFDGEEEVDEGKNRKNIRLENEMHNENIKESAIIENEEDNESDIVIVSKNGDDEESIHESDVEILNNNMRVISGKKRKLKSNENEMKEYLGNSHHNRKKRKIQNRLRIPCADICNILLSKNIENIGGPEFLMQSDVEFTERTNCNESKGDKEANEDTNINLSLRERLQRRGIH